MFPGDVHWLIQRYVKPILEQECQRLNVDPCKIKAVKGCYPKPFEYSAYLGIYPDEFSPNRTYEIRIGTDLDNVGDCVRAFLHELRHLKFCEENKRHSELKCHLYSWKRYFQLLFSGELR